MSAEKEVQLVDTHTHLEDEVFDEDRREVLRRAREAGVATVIVVSETLDDARRCLQLAAEHPSRIRPAAGLYPTVLDRDQAAEMEELIRANRERLCAIGEVGLDYWKVQDEPQREIQREIFGRFVDLSMEIGLPLNVHSRSAGRHAIEFLLSRGAERVQLHAFDGKPSTAMPAVEAGYYFSIPPSIVRSRQKQKLVRQLPLSCLLLETDSPVLAPVAGERNEPANVVVSLGTVAEIKGITPERLAGIVSENTSRLYGDLAGPEPR